DADEAARAREASSYPRTVADGVSGARADGSSRQLLAVGANRLQRRAHRFQRTLRQGQTVRFGLGKPLWIRFGAPWNLEGRISHRSVAAELPSQIGDVLATRVGLRSVP